MIPNNSFSSIYVRFAGEQALLSMAQANLIGRIERLARVRTHTYLSNNAQNEHGISRNFGEERCYSWEDTVIDCRNAPNLVESDAVKDYEETILENKRFKALQEDLEGRMGGFVKVVPFLSVLRGADNMRYSIKRASKVEDFDMIRMGFKLVAKDEAAFKMGMCCLKDHENPFKMKQHIMNNAQPMHA